VSSNQLSRNKFPQRTEKGRILPDSLFYKAFAISMLKSRKNNKEKGVLLPYFTYAY
jgi:hypothetical protein